MYFSISIDLKKTSGGLPETSRAVVADALHTLADEVEAGMDLSGAGNVDAPEFGDTIGFWEVTE